MDRRILSLNEFSRRHFEIHPEGMSTPRFARPQRYRYEEIQSVHGQVIRGVRTACGDGDSVDNADQAKHPVGLLERFLTYDSKTNVGTASVGHAYSLSWSQNGHNSELKHSRCHDVGSPNPLEYWCRRR